MVYSKEGEMVINENFTLCLCWLMFVIKDLLKYASIFLCLLICTFIQYFNLGSLIELNVRLFTCISNLALFNSLSFLKVNFADICCLSLTKLYIRIWLQSVCSLLKCTQARSGWYGLDISVGLRPYDHDIYQLGLV